MSVADSKTWKGGYSYASSANSSTRSNDSGRTLRSKAVSWS